MDDSFRSVLQETQDLCSSILKYGYSDSSHDDLDRIADRLRWAWQCQEDDMNGQPPATWEFWFQGRYGHNPS